MDDIMSLCKRRGFIYQASEIYGGINGFWDYGPLGTMLKRNLREAWWQDVVMMPCWGRKGPDGEPVTNLPLDTCIIQNPKVWEASGHVAGFNDPMVDDKETKQRFRADHLFGLFVCISGDYAKDGLIRLVAFMTKVPPVRTVVASSSHEALELALADRKAMKPYKLGAVLDRITGGDESSTIIEVEDKDGAKGFGLFVPVYAGKWGTEYLRSNPQLIPSPFSGKSGSLTEPRAFNLMFKTFIGATAGADDIAYLRPETAQGIFVNFKNVVDTNRVKVPFGIAQTGKAFRNEVTPRNFTYRSREFEQMEIEFFCHESQAMDWYAFWRDWRMEWWKSIGLGGENIILREHAADELAHYSKATSDIEYRFPFTAPGFGELEGIAYRGNFDLTQHQKHSGAKLEYNDTTRGELAANGQPKGERYLPHVIEPSAGLDRGVLALLCEAYTKDASRASPEFMKFHPRIAPIKAAVFPLVNKDGMPEVAEKLHADLMKKFGRTGLIETDPKQSIGKRYARMDEAGCPFCFTIDGETLTNQTVTVRDRDTGGQERIALNTVVSFVSEKLGM
jgi:glycyl-tRNA synthetase